MDFGFNVSHLPDWPFTGWFLCWSWATMFHWRTQISHLWLGMNKSNKYSSNWKKNWNPSRASSGTASAWTSGSCCLVAFLGQWPLMVSHFNSKLWSLDVISCSTGYLWSKSALKKICPIVEMHQNVNLLQSRFLCLHGKYIFHSGRVGGKNSWPKSWHGPILQVTFSVSIFHWGHLLTRS